MKVSHISLRNWRNFKSVDVDLSDRTFLIGPNACGKSNFLDVFRFMRDIAKPGGGLQKAIEDRGGLSKICCLAARGHLNVEIVVTLRNGSSTSDEWVYAIGIKQEARGHRNPLLSYERVSKNGGIVIERPDPEDEQDKARLTRTHLEQINANQEFREIAQFFESISYMHVIPQLLRSPEIFSGAEMTGEQFGRRFMERVAKTTERTRSSRLAKIEEALRTVVPQFSSLTSVRDEQGAPHLEARYAHWRLIPAKHLEDQFSDGTLRLLGLLWALLDGDSLLLLEEPELSP